MKSVKTLDEHRASLRRILKLGAYAACCYRRTVPAEPLEAIFRTRTPVAAVCFGTASDREFPDFPRECDDVETFERAVERRFGAEVDAFAEAGYAHSLGVWVDPKWSFGSLRYDQRGDVCVFHITNACAPESIFSDPSYLPRQFLKLFADASAHGCRWACTGSWLNDEPRFIGLFPEAYRGSLFETDELPQAHFGYWGQIFNARGLLSTRVEALIRGNDGRLPRRMKRAGCDLATLCDHFAKVSR